MHPDKRKSRTVYQQVFRTNFSTLRFSTPRLDTCKYCDMLYHKLIAADNDTDAAKVKLESDFHYAGAEQSYSALKRNTVFANERQSHCNMQLSCYNFAIHEAWSNRVTMNIWDETVGKRGSADIVSCILKDVPDNFAVLKEGEERKLIIWSDRCVGQNNNWRNIALYCCLVQCPYFSEIHQKFLCSGHSFLPCDRDFALIKKIKDSISSNGSCGVEVCYIKHFCEQTPCYRRNVAEGRQRFVVLRRGEDHVRNYHNHVPHLHYLIYTLNDCQSRRKGGGFDGHDTIYGTMAQDVL
ncbi:hypothetical protein PR048_013870 [Dryococelus australis]|uniref:DUF7869 domain-containing protein n=1 Tax=Dryococelus australis TaxID=614101 RepID=A0ABQ9HTF2_9NEOP|nr:hypothetical protein PR048_013870 [Dryococelus australis]